MVWTMAEKGQNKFSPQCLALCSSPQVPQVILPAVATFQHPLALLCSPAVGDLVIKLISSFILPPRFGSEQELSVFFRGDFGKRGYFFLSL